MSSGDIPGFNVFDTAARGPAPPPLPSIVPGVVPKQPVSFSGFSSGRYVTDQDLLYLQWQDPLDTEGTLQITARVLLPDGSVSLLEAQQVLDGTVTPEFVTYPLTEGFLLNVTVTSIGNVIEPGWAYVTVGLCRPPTGTLQVSEKLAAGYPNDLDPLSWPSDACVEPGDGPTFPVFALKNGNGPNGFPSLSLKHFALYRLVAAQWKVVTSAVVANRQARLAIVTSGNPDNWINFVGQTAITAGSTTIVSFSDSSQEISVPGFLNIPIAKRLALQGPWQIHFELLNFDVGDVVGSQTANVLYEPWAGFTQ